jgi:ActR/RegA family two-component response regulator
MEYHDHGYPMIEAVSSSSSVSHVVVMGGYAPVSVVIVVIEGGYIHIWRDTHVGSSQG